MTAVTGYYFNHCHVQYIRRKDVLQAPFPMSPEECIHSPSSMASTFFAYCNPFGDEGKQENSKLITMLMHSDSTLVVKMRD